MRVLQVPERRPDRPSPHRGSWRWRSAHFQDACRHAPHDRIVRHILDDHRLGPDDGLVTHPYPSKDLGTSPHLDAVANGGGAERIVHPGVTDGDTVTNHTVIPHYSGPMDDYAAVMLDAQAAADLGGRADTDPAEDLGEL